jgi:hypothetical protein
MEVKTFTKIRCSMLVTFVLSGNCNVRVGELLWCAFVSVMCCVLHLWYQVFDGISMCVICNDGVDMLCIEMKLANSCL